jgi:hypothetical protein
MTSGTMRTLVATDLARAGSSDDSWHRSQIGCQCLASGEWVTSAGYAFAERATSPPESDTLKVLILPQDQVRNRPEDTQNARRLSVTISQGETIVEVGRGRALVGIESAQWAVCAAPILLAISVSWRFYEMERNLDELSAWARSRLQTGEGRLTGSRASELTHRFRALHALIVDLPSFEGSLDDPSRYFASSDQTRLYRRLARRLELAAWRTRLDEQIEILEAALGALVDEQRHRQLLRWEIALESLILLALLGDIGIHLALALLE